MKNPQSEYEEWLITVENQLRDHEGAARAFARKTKEGIEIKPLYTEGDLPVDDAYKSMPGFPPYMRGGQASMYRGKPWTIRQYAGFSTAKDSNAFFKRLLKSGAQGISVAFDLPTHRGYDSDDASVKGDVGKSGVAIDTVEDMKLLFAGIDLSNTTVSMTMSGAVLPILAAFIVAAEEQGVEKEKLKGTIQNDILKEFMVRNTYIYPPKESMSIVGDIIAYTSKNMPGFNSISISGYHMQEAGADAITELAYTLANGKAYIETACKKGLKIDEFAPRLSFFWGVGMDFYMEIAKLRAARKLWYDIVSRYQPKNPKSLVLRAHCQTSGCSLVEQDPQNNIVRTSIEALAAIFGGTQSLHTNSFDEAIGLPSDEAAIIARNTQLIIKHETGIPEVIDPWGGSFMMESLTQQVIDKVEIVLNELHENGGIEQAIENGFAKLAIEKAAAKRQAEIDMGDQIIVGLNKYQSNLSSPPVFEVDNEQVVKEQIERIQHTKRNRDQQAVYRALSELKIAAKTQESNLLEACIQAIRVRASVGEISATLVEVFGRYTPLMQLGKGVFSKKAASYDDWQLIQKGIAKFTNKVGRKPRMLVTKMGQDGHDRGAKVIAMAFADMGFDIDLPPLFSEPKYIAKLAIDNDVHVIGVSSHAGSHKSLIRELRAELISLQADDIMVVVGGVIPKKDYQELVHLKVKHIFGPGSNIFLAARDILDDILIRYQHRSAAETADI